MTPIILNDLMYDRGRGPELRRCRLTVYDLIPYLESEDPSDELMFRAWPFVTPEELAALKQYIADHRDEVMAVHEQIEARHQKAWAAQQTPEFRARFGITEGRVTYYPTWLEKREAEAAEGGPPLPPAGPDRIREYAQWWQNTHNGTANGAHQ